jgi:hypothetical protein
MSITTGTLVVWDTLMFYKETSLKPYNIFVIFCDA